MPSIFFKFLIGTVLFLNVYSAQAQNCAKVFSRTSTGFTLDEVTLDRRYEVFRPQSATIAYGKETFSNLTSAEGQKILDIIAERVDPLMANASPEWQSKYKFFMKSANYFTGYFGPVMLFRGPEPGLFILVASPPVLDTYRPVHSGPTDYSYVPPLREGWIQIIDFNRSEYANFPLTETKSLYSDFEVANLKVWDRAFMAESTEGQFDKIHFNYEPSDMAQGMELKLLAKVGDSKNAALKNFSGSEVREVNGLYFGVYNNGGKSYIRVVDAKTGAVVSDRLISDYLTVNQGLMLRNGSPPSYGIGVVYVEQRPEGYAMVLSNDKAYRLLF